MWPTLFLVYKVKILPPFSHTPQSASRRCSSGRWTPRHLAVRSCCHAPCGSCARFCMEPVRSVGTDGDIALPHAARIPTSRFDVHPPPQRLSPVLARGIALPIMFRSSCSQFCANHALLVPQDRFSSNLRCRARGYRAAWAVVNVSACRAACRRPLLLW